MSAAVVVIPASAAQAAADSCVDQRTGQTYTSNKTGTSGPDTFATNATNATNAEFRIESGDVISAREGKDRVIVDPSLSDLDFVDAQPFHDGDVCLNVESAVGCEILNFPG